jgi:hypothetical protein
MLFKIKKPNDNQNGFAAFLATILIMAIIFGIGVSIFMLTYNEQKIIQNVLKSTQAYFSSEAGLEDALLRLASGKDWSSSYNLVLNSGTSSVAISEVVGGSRTITSVAEAAGRYRKNQVVYEISDKGFSFFYGAQIGEGGLVLDDLSKVNGNVFSNGSILMEDGAEITGTAKVAKNGNRIEGGEILEDAYADICQDSSISGSLYYRTNNGCSAGSLVFLPQEIATDSLPISDEEIVDWKEEALAGGVYSGDYTLSEGNAFLGPKKIEGNLLVEGNSHFFLTGTLWVTEKVTIKNNAIVGLDPNSYGSFSGMIISDNLIVLQNNSISRGSGLAGSYLMYLSTAPLNPAIQVQNNSISDIIYTNNGWIEIENNAEMREITGYGIHLKNNSSVTYEIGLEDSNFISGPAGGWGVASWKEIE